MEKLRVHPNTEEELKDEASPYNPEFVAKIKRGEKAKAEGKGVTVDLKTFTL